MRASAVRSVLLVAVALAGCDSYRLEPITDALLVSVVEGGLLPFVPDPVLVLETERSMGLGCNARIETDAEGDRGRLRLRVRGISPGGTRPCPLGAPAYAFVPLPAFGTDGVAVEIRHRGSADRYRVYEVEAGVALEALTTRTTRPSP